MENSQENKLGKKIKSLRIKFELSQDEFARKADVPYRHHTIKQDYCDIIKLCRQMN